VSAAALQGKIDRQEILVRRRSFRVVVMSGRHGLHLIRLAISS
jgi:hypothetical protein